MKTEIKQAQAMIHNSDAILISASNGLSIAEGYNIFADDENFEKYFEHFRVLSLSKPFNWKCESAFEVTTK